MAPWAQFFILLHLLPITCISALHHWGSSFDMTKRFTTSTYADLPPDFVTFYYKQTLDHFNYRPESYQSFQQRYILNYRYWGGANTRSPIFVYTGAEIDVTQALPRTGFIADLAARFNGLQLYIEHRYYGESIPFGSLNGQNASTLGYFSSTQALADYAQLILDAKKNLSAENCPVIAIGGSYGGMLASWFRLKYPHIVIGALASSAPILYFDDITPQDGYYDVVSKVFKNASESCYYTIKQSWYEIDRVASEPNGLLTLGNIFNSCFPLNSTKELKNYLTFGYTSAAQSNNPPNDFVKDICNAIDGAPEGTDILARVAAGRNSSYFGSGGSCQYISDEELPVEANPWIWQACTEIVMPIGVDNNNTMFEESPFDIVSYTKQCQDVTGATPRPHWITTYFGGYDIKSTLRTFGSNIIFSNGLRDPYSSGGVLEDISDTIVAVYTEQGAHVLDMHGSTPEDPDWLVAQRKKEIMIISLWIAKYKAKVTTNVNE